MANSSAIKLVWYLITGHYCVDSTRTSGNAEDLSQMTLAVECDIKLQPYPFVI